MLHPTTTPRQSSALTKSDLEHPEVLKAYFTRIVALHESGEKFPVNLDEVWPLVYTQKGRAILELKKNFIEGDDYLVFSQKVKNLAGGRPVMNYMLSVKCLEYFIARKVRPVFEVYSKVLHERIKEEKNPDLIADRYINTYRKKGKADDWIKARFEGKVVRNEFTAVLAEHGVVRDGYRNCTNAIYAPLFGGTTAVVREKKGLDKSDNIRDNLSPVELEAVKFSEMLTKEKIKAENLKGNAQCEMACTRSARAVANAMIQVMGK